MDKGRKSRQQVKKIVQKVCFFCGEDDYNLLEAHRIFEGSKGGTYDPRNTLCTCANCHKKSHKNRIKIHGKHYSTKGVWVVHYTEDGEEKWREE